MSLRGPPDDAERRRAPAPANAPAPARLKAVLDVGKARASAPTGTPMFVPGPLWRHVPAPTPDPAAPTRPYADTEPTPHPSYRGWSALRRARPFRVYVNEELGMGTEVEFTPLVDGSMETIVTPNNDGLLYAYFGIQFYKSEWHFSGRPGQERPTKVVLPSGDIIYPEFAETSDGDLWLEAYGYQDKDGFTTRIIRNEDGAYVTALDLSDGPRTWWDDAAEMCVNGLVLCIAWLLIAAANAPAVRAHAAFGDKELFAKLKRAEARRHVLKDKSWEPSYDGVAE